MRLLVNKIYFLDMTCLCVIDVTSFSVSESVRRECGVDMVVFARRAIVLSQW